MKKLSVDDLSFKGKRTLIRVDFNVPLDENFNITDDIRITASLPTIKKVMKDGGKVILMSHLGRPKGGPNPKYSLKPVAVHLQTLLDMDVKFAQDCIGEQVEAIVNAMKDGDVLLLENLRFHPEEEKNDPEFAKKLASLGDVYVNDAFGTAHRAHASTEGVTKYISTCASGYLMQKELEYLGQAISNPARPYTAILGGAKISGKIDVIQNLLPKVDNLIIGGGMVFTFFKAMGYEIGTSLLEEEKVQLAKETLEAAIAQNKNIYLPVDIVAAPEFKNEAPATIVKASAMPKDQMGLDIGPDAVNEFKNIILNSKTVVWNGPMGVFEFDNYSRGTDEIASALAEATSKGAVTVVGGGDSAAAIKKAGLDEKVSHVSTGGGASLEFLEGKVLPGVIALSDAK